MFINYLQLILLYAVQNFFENYLNLKIFKHFILVLLKLKVLVCSYYYFLFFFKFKYKKNINASLTL